jgi:3-dehydroquinate synthase
MSLHDFQFQVSHKHRVLFTRDGFAESNHSLDELFIGFQGKTALVYLEHAVAIAWPDLKRQIPECIRRLGMELAAFEVETGGEACKQDEDLVRKVWAGIDAAHIDRHSFVFVIGGGAFLDAVGFAAATAHRGVRLVRFPTTTLAQGDSGVGVKCAINALGKKNWLGAFAVPFAVVNDVRFLSSLTPEVAREGLIEAVKVALVKDSGFFDWLETHVVALAALDPAFLEPCIERSALLHARHIAECGDPFENGSSRPLDFGHWAAHKLEAMSRYQLSHGNAVSVGLALDVLYSQHDGTLSPGSTQRILRVLKQLDLPTHHPLLGQRGADGALALLNGLEEFREHLGGQLTVLMLRDIGHGEDRHQIDPHVVERCVKELSPAPLP